jgi:hypothetical protein
VGQHKWAAALSVEWAATRCEARGTLAGGQAGRALGRQVWKQGGTHLIQHARGAADKHPRLVAPVGQHVEAVARLGAGDWEACTAAQRSTAWGSTGCEAAHRSLAWTTARGAALGWCLQTSLLNPTTLQGIPSTARHSTEWHSVWLHEAAHLWRSRCRSASHIPQSRPAAGGRRRATKPLQEGRRWGSGAVQCIAYSAACIPGAGS